MLVVVEGVDGSGKSSLAKEIARRARMHLYDHEFVNKEISVMDPAANIREQQAAVNIAAGTGTDIVFDRLFVSEWVYDTHYGREFDELAVERLDKTVSEVPHLGIMLLADSEWECKRVHDRQKDLAVSEYDIVQLNDLYQDYLKTSRMEWLVLSPNDAFPVIVQAAMLKITQARPTKDEVFMNMAKEASRRATCLSRRQGAVLVSPTGHMLATGYNGAPAGLPHPTMCSRLLSGVMSGKDLEACTDVHAEENVIAQAAMYGSDTRGSTIYTLITPCTRCARMLINAGVKEVVYKEEYADAEGIAMLKAAKIRLRKQEES